MIESSQNQSLDYISREEYKVKIAREWSHEWPRFDFKYGVLSGHCFLRVTISKGVPIFLCAQLIDYFGRSITNSVERIFEKAIYELRKTNVIVSIRTRSPFDHLMPKRFSGLVDEDIYKFFLKESIWIEHYPPGTAITEDGTYALVRFDDEMNPSWNYRRKDVICGKIKQIVSDCSFLDIKRDALIFEE